jgi:hypothetical protein
MDAAQGAGSGGQNRHPRKTGLARGGADQRGAERQHRVRHRLHDHGLLGRAQRPYRPVGREAN